jgi:Fe-S oxidoreductase
MSLIQSISSTLRTWVFKKKLLKFSDRYRWETQACFYCPEMCRFSCPTSETLKTNAVTPRGKMSLLHLAEKGYSEEQVAGSAEAREWYLEQCTGCGRCTEYCLYENDVGTHLRNERSSYFSKLGTASVSSKEKELSPLLAKLRGLRGTVFFCEVGRGSWWQSRSALLAELGVSEAHEIAFPHLDWGWGKLSSNEVRAIGEALSNCSRIWVESPELGWFLAKGIKDENKALSAEIRMVWQMFFPRVAARALDRGISFHESFHLARLFPRIGYSIPMYERGEMPFHHGWNMLDCGGEGYYRHAHPETARKMAERFVTDLGSDGREVRKIVCQNLSCVEHLKNSGLNTEPVYWLDAMLD